MLTDVREPKSCAYIFTITTPRLCKHSAFQDRIPMAVPVVCYPSLSTNCDGEQCTSVPAGVVAGAGGVAAKPIPVLNDGINDEVESVDGSKAKNSTSTAVLDGDGDEISEEKADGVGLGDVFNGGHDDEYY